MQQVFIDAILEMVFLTAFKVTPGKPADVRCMQLDDHDGCRIFGQPGRPRVCGGLPPSREMCGESREQAMFFLTELERLTA